MKGRGRSRRSRRVSGDRRSDRRGGGECRSRGRVCRERASGAWDDRGGIGGVRGRDAVWTFEVVHDRQTSDPRRATSAE